MAAESGRSLGHNLKIAWNLTRCAYYFQGPSGCVARATQDADGYTERSDRCLEVAQRLADRMGQVGLDKIRVASSTASICPGMPTQFAWESTKDFWQQEQGILADPILFGATG